MPSLMAFLGLNNSSFLKKLDESKKEAAAVGHEIASSLGEVITEKLAQFASIAFFEHLVESTIEWGEQISVLSQRLGISTEGVQQWDYALKLNNSSIQAATGFFEKLSIARKKALEGKDEQIQAFKDLGVSIEDLKNKRIEDIGRQIAEAFESGDPQKLIASLREVGGKGAGELVAAFKDGFAQLLAEAPKVGDAIIDSLREAADVSHTIWAEMRAGFAPIVAFFAKVGQGLQRGLQTAVETVVGMFRPGAGGVDAALKELQDKFDEQDKELEERQKKRHQPIAAGGLEETESKEAAREEKRLAEEKFRLEEKLFQLRQKNALEALPKEQQINELHRRRVELAQYVAAHWKEMSDKGRLQAQIDLEELAGEEARAERSLKDKDKKEKTHSPDVNQLQRIGAFSEPPSEAVKIDLHRKSERHLAGIYQGVQTLVQRSTGGTQY